MKRYITTAIFLAIAGCALLRAQDYPFQDTKLPEEERLDNAVSLMTVDEKLATLLGQGVPRLGIADMGFTQAMHGIVRGGTTDLPSVREFGSGRSPQPVQGYRHSTTFPQAYGIGETWDREIVHKIGDLMAREARKRLGAQDDRMVIYSDEDLVRWGVPPIMAHFSWVPLLDDYSAGSPMDWIIKQF